VSCGSALAAAVSTVSVRDRAGLGLLGVVCAGCYLSCAESYPCSVCFQLDLATYS
jgi:hypothetical protein